MQNKNVRKTAGYVLYVVICNLCICFVALVLTEAPVFHSFEMMPRYALKLGLFMLLGILWAAEDILALRTGGRVVIWIRCINILWLLALCLSFFITKRLTYVNLCGMEPVVELIAGILVVRVLRGMRQKVEN